jgi:hypothetical protein
MQESAPSNPLATTHTAIVARLKFPRERILDCNIAFLPVAPFTNCLRNSSETRPARTNGEINPQRKRARTDRLSKRRALLAQWNSHPGHARTVAR